jgi:hypothetical protein
MVCFIQWDFTGDFGIGQKKLVEGTGHVTN